jgi:hypothetical protein
MIVRSEATHACPQLTIIKGPKETPPKRGYVSCVFGMRTAGFSADTLQYFLRVY